MHIAYKQLCSIMIYFIMLCIRKSCPMWLTGLMIHKDDSEQIIIIEQGVKNAFTKQSEIDESLNLLIPKSST